jgi:hypothetical protein
LVEKAGHQAGNDDERAEVARAGELLKEAQSAAEQNNAAKSRDLIDRATLIALKILAR